MNKIALYIRLSVEDNIEKEESESITNQRMFLNDYLDRNEELKSYQREEYVDDGYSGTNEKRPAFQRMLEDIKISKVGVVVVKDLSRFMRDYIVLGDYLENIFPFLSIRFIAINDGYDSAKEKGNGTDLDIQFKGLLYDFYAKDISEKVKTVTTTLKKQGKFLAWSPPLGYMKDPNDKYKIIVDDKTSLVIKKIFTLALDGTASRNIAKILNEKNIPTPSQRKKELTNMDYGYNVITSEGRDKPTWTNGNVIDILSNENYTGTYVFNMQEKSILKPGSFKFHPKDKWERVFDNHELIISRENFDKVQKIRDSKRFMEGKNTDFLWRQKSPLQGFARCFICNHILSCTQSKRTTKFNEIKIHRYFFCRICKCNSIETKNSRADDLEEQVFSMIKKKYGEDTVKPKEMVNTKSLEKKIENLQAKKMNEFERYKLGKMTKTKFVESKTKIESEIIIFQRQIATAKVSKDVVKDNELTRKLMEKYIESVICERNKVLNIIWK